MTGGSIPLCPFNGCGFRCCEFQQGNFIVMYPGELEAAVERGESVEHLDVFDTLEGGFKARCHASDTGTCDDGFKPLDCRSYPFFPVVDDAGASIEADLKGSKCPLIVSEIGFHRR